MEKIQSLRYLSLEILLFSLIVSLHAQGQVDTTQLKKLDPQYNIIQIKTDTLPELNIARSGHKEFCLDGELTVFGGHTSGFVPTPTAEYYQDGKWHLIPMDYTHDHGVAIQLRSGKVFLAGGHKEPLGIGQLFSAELYDPKIKKFQGFGCLVQKRAFANALEMADGQIIISGNWHEQDGIEMFENVYDTDITNAIEVKKVSYGRAHPYILRISNDDAIIFSSLSDKHEPVDYSVVDRLKDESYNEPFLNTWSPIRTIIVHRSLNQFIGDEAHGRYEWLLPVYNEETSQVAIAKVEGITKNSPKPTFSLLPLAEPLPLSIEDKDLIYSSLICDRSREMAYLIGNDEEARIYVITFPYDSASAPAPLTIYITEPQPIFANTISPMITPEGDLIFAGGRLENNFYPSKSVIKLPLGDFYNPSEDTLVQGGTVITKNSLWWWIGLGCLVVFGSAVIIIFLSRRKSLSRADNVNTCSRPSASASGDNPEKVVTSLNTPTTEIDLDSNTSFEPRILLTSKDKNTDQGITEEIPELEFEEDLPIDKNLPKEEILPNLFKRIEQLMEQEKLYLNYNLKTIDVANRLKSNVSYVSAAINSQRGCSFSQLITLYRISYAQKLMLEDPDQKLVNISHRSGFITESTFFRAFRSVTGMAPKEWLASKNIRSEQ